MDWKDYRIFCQWCKREIEIIKWNTEPDIEWYEGRKFKSTGRYWHKWCIQQKLNIENERTRKI